MPASSEPEIVVVGGGGGGVEELYGDVVTSPVGDEASAEDGGCKPEVLEGDEDMMASILNADERDFGAAAAIDFWRNISPADKWLTDTAIKYCR